jgi:uncharacterized protein YjbI with pentapeptide repeats
VETIELKQTRRRVDALDADMSGSSFVNVNLSSATFRDVNLSGATLRDINLSGVSIVDCRTDGMTIEGVAVEDLLAAYRAAKSE